MKKLNLTFCSFPDYVGNAKVLYEYIKKRYKDSMNCTWIVNEEKSKELLKDIGANIITIGSKEFNEYISKTDVFFTTHANLAGDKSKTKNGIYIELWHGIGPKPIGFLSNNLSQKDEEWYNFISETIDYFIVPSEMWKTIFSSMIGINARRIKSLGMPLLDEISNAKGKENLSKVLNLDADKYDKIIMYMPTFKKGCGRDLEASINEENILNLYDYNDDELIKYLKDRNYLLIVKRHPSDECKYKIINNQNIQHITTEMLAKHKLNTNSIMNAGDLMITDYSSVGTEFSFLDRPSIYLTTDIEEYKKNRGIVLEDYDFWSGGITSNSYKDLTEKIDNLIGNSFIHKYKNMFFGELKDGGCNKICDFVFKGNSLNPQLKRYESEILNLKVKNENQNKKLEAKNEIINEQINTIKRLTESDIELNQIKNSRSWKFLEKYRKIRYGRR